LVEQAKREENRRKQEIEEIRVKFLVKRLDEWKDLQSIKAFITDVAKTAPDMPEG
jgi:ribosomal protein S18